MTVKQIIDFLSRYDGEQIVTMLQCSGDNPMDEDYDIKELIAIEGTKAVLKIVIIPE
ncbi:MAG: hypothetical protein IIX10_03070 [Clostridia bacterium]|nr:hypothetical protein [Clostridia bacterium]